MLEIPAGYRVVNLKRDSCLRWPTIGVGIWVLGAVAVRFADGWHWFNWIMLAGAALNSAVYAWMIWYLTIHDPQSMRADVRGIERGTFGYTPDGKPYVPKSGLETGE